jgi:hypothetical protein
MSPCSSNNPDQAPGRGIEDEISVQPERIEPEQTQRPTLWQVITTKVKDYGLVVAVGIAAILVVRFAKSAGIGSLTRAMTGAMSGLGMSGTNSL